MNSISDELFYENGTSYRTCVHCHHKIEYSKPELEIIQLNNDDIIVTSSYDNNDDPNVISGDYPW